MTDRADGAVIAVGRGFYVGLAVLITALAVAGFWPTYWGPLFSGTLDLHWLLHLHGVVFTGWLILLITQTALVYRGRTDLHQTTGKVVGVGLGILVITVGLAAIFGSVSPAIGHEYESLQGFVSSVLAINLPGIFAFTVLFGAGLAYRDRPAIHKRLMIVATLALLSAGTARLGINVVGLPSFVGTAVGRSLPVLLAGLAVGYDWWSRRSVHPVYWIAASILLLDDGMALVTPTDTWRDFTEQVAAALQSVLLPLM